MLTLLAAAPTTVFLLRNPVASASHFLWCVFCLFAGAFLVRLPRGDRLKTITLSIFTASMVLLYFASGLYHALILTPETLHWFRMADHSAIFLLIAGSYTPVAAVLLRGRARSFLLTTVWTMAVLGIASKWLLRMPSYPLTVGIYIGMGWVGVMQAPALIRALGPRGVGMLLLSGVLYTVGGISDALAWPDLWPGIVGPHEVMHLCDMAGTTVHILVLLQYVVPHRAVRTGDLLRDLMNARELAADEVARGTAIAPSILAAVLQNTRRLTFPQANSLAAFFQVEPALLLA